MFWLKVKSFFSSIGKPVAILFLSLLGLILVVFAYTSVKDYQDRKEKEIYKVVKEWDIDMSDPLQMKVLLKTRYLNSQLEAIVEVEGYPEYLSDPVEGPKNKNKELIFYFKDNDGFDIKTKEVKISELSMRTNGNGGYRGMRGKYRNT